MANIFRSARLLYRAVEDYDRDFIHSVESDPAISGNANVDLLKPASKRNVKGFVHFMQETALLGVIVCLQPPPEDGTFSPHSSDTTTTPAATPATRAEHRHSPSNWNGPGRSPSTSPASATPIGYISLAHELGPANPHHRSASIGISIAADHQGRGYGTEAINWILDWGFDVAGLHRVAITSFAYNDGAGRLYERLGFVLEGRRRDALWFRGAFHDMLLFSMLRHEWEERTAGKVSIGGT
ncbi:putative gnat family protein [Neofusicoccum parvum UCRNP2]|uniref:GNAT family protein n=2 Tax=Neofusicoccum parvum TaxID=310453 RepID=A0ACB5SD50_9PEZI|nr:putative gnat family protein [Neofusicoccum parvum UCRNP2]GME35796.1 GNAT family protein [Neofusicoccum parvum]